MDLSEVSKLAHVRGCVLQIAGCDGALLYWIENAIFVSKPFDCLENLVDLLLHLPVYSPEVMQKPETIYLPQSAEVSSIAIAA